MQLHVVEYVSFYSIFEVDFKSISDPRYVSWPTETIPTSGENQSFDYNLATVSKAHEYQSSNENSSNILVTYVEDLKHSRQWSDVLARPE